MKRKISYYITLRYLLFNFFLIVVSTISAFGMNSEQNSQETKKLQEQEKQILTLRKEVEELDSVYNVTSNILGKIKTEASKKPEVKKHWEIIDIDKKLTKKSNTVLNTCISLLQIPYDDFTFSQIAIPIYERVVYEGSTTSIMESRLDLLKNYKEDFKELNAYLSNLTAALYNFQNSSKFSNWFNRQLNNFQNNSVVSRYKNSFDYNELNKTYLGKIIIEVENLMKKYNNFESKNLLADTIKQINW